MWIFDLKNKKHESKCINCIRITTIVILSIILLFVFTILLYKVIDENSYMSITYSPIQNIEVPGKLTLWSLKNL